MLSAGVKDLKDLNDLFIKHAHTGIDFSPKLPIDFLISHTLPGTMPATAGNYGPFFTAQFPVQVMGFSGGFTTAGSDAGAVTLQLERLQGTEAPGDGDDLLSSALNLKGTANTVQTGDFGTAKTLRNLLTGDRLGLVLTGTPTAVAGLNATVWLRKL